MSVCSLIGALLSLIASFAAGLTAAGPVLASDKLAAGGDGSASLSEITVSSKSSSTELRQKRMMRKEALVFQTMAEAHEQMRELRAEQAAAATHQGPKDARGFPLLVALGFRPQRILDIGANVGDWTRGFLKLFPNASFLMIDGTDHLRRWQDLLHTVNPGQVQGEVAILGDRDGAVDWYAESTVDTGNSVHREQSALFNTTKALVRPIQTLDHLLQRTKHDPIFDLVKLDVQGSELDVLRGARDVLSHAQVLLLEMPFVGTFNEGSPSFAQYIDFLDAEGFTPFDIEQFHRVTSNGGIKTDDGNQDHGFLIQVDFIFVRKGSGFLEEAQKSIRLVGSDIVAKEARKHPYNQLVRDFYTIH